MTGDSIDTPAPIPPRASQGVEFLRVVQQHHIQLSSMADFKANVLLGASVLIFSTSLKQVHDGAASAPLIVLMATAFLAATFAVLAMLPMTSHRPNPRQNMLFFGVFSKLDEEDFQSRMAELLADEKELHRAMVRDIYQIGWVLQVKKYRRLGQAYRVFFAGLMASGLTLAGQLAWRYLG
jgi:Family of unknown function (DUF5706)